MSSSSSNSSSSSSSLGDLANRAARSAGEASRRLAAQVIGSPGDDSIIDITMLGPSGAGKTTLLASMYERFPRVIGLTNLEVSAVDPATDQTMQRYISDLRRSPLTPRVQDGIEGSELIREYRFEVGRKARYPVLSLRFTDYPGRRFTESGISPADELMVQRALRRADVILIAIDVPPIMENDGVHSAANMVDLVAAAIRRMLREDRQRLIMMVLLKCEKYLQSGQLTDLMIKRVKEEYAPVLDFLRSSDVAQRVACVFTPVQTIGTVVFKDLSYLDGDRSKPIFNFMTTSMRAKYAPVDTEQPLRYVLRFVLGKYMSDRSKVQVWLQKLFGDDRALVEATREFAEGSKRTDGFEVFIDHPFLHPRRV